MLLVIGVAGSAAIFVAEMLAGRLGSLGVVATQEFLDTLFSGPIAGPMIPVALALFVGAAVAAGPLIADSGPLRWPAVVLLVGTLFVLAEIISSQVLLSQIGNLLIWSGSAAFAWLLVRGEVARRRGQAQARRSLLASRLSTRIDRLRPKGEERGAPWARCLPAAPGPIDAQSKVLRLTLAQACATCGKHSA